ncbi:uncharacterized protein TM35_000017080 [Trypanosoma theileri]|uniref:Uncharacterized protein n=1 Tax=Trypanosoma theileri TaxID=67003 RepID=A0A1X0PAH9_9TRYP|nr:uncharacterized protein TM35_000017080 [Trypanosoma theileri]ORC93831.1 hypothetical protein TM35_000017080 [Trypanosoma theileri]
MTSSQVLELAKDSSLVLARDVSFPQDEVRAAFETIRAAEEDHYSVLYTVTGRDDKSRNWMAVLCRGMHEAAKMQETFDGSSHVDVYALQKSNVSIAAVASSPRHSRPSLRPAAPLFLREYSVVTRQEAETRAASSAVAPPTPPVKAEEPEKVPEISTVNLREEAPVTRVSLTAMEVVAPSIKEVPKQEKVKELPKESAEKKKKPPSQQQTLFGSMLGGEKHARDSTVSSTKTEPKTKKSRSAKATDESKNKNTTSLLKLAKASKKNKVNTQDRTIASNNTTTNIDNNNNTDPKITSTSRSNGLGLLDEDEEHDNNNGNSSNSEKNSRSNSYLREMEFMNEEPQNLDIVVTAVTNDDIIICDDAPPMVFCAPEASISPLKKEQQQQKKCDAAVSLDQPKLTGFFHPDVGIFQNTYVLEVKTETVFENDEYISRDVVYYRHKENGELISEEEFHRRSIEVSRKVCENAQKTNSTNGSLSDAPSPAAECNERTFIEAARNSKPPKIERLLRSQPKTLMSYFKSASS